MLRHNNTYQAVGNGRLCEGGQQAHHVAHCVVHRQLLVERSVCVRVCVCVCVSVCVCARVML